MPVPIAELPALPLHEAGKYVAGAYVVLFALVLIYVAIMAVRLGRLERDLGELLQREQEAPATQGDSPTSGAANVADARTDSATRESTLV
jgi:hypothetical protein